MTAKTRNRLIAFSIIAAPFVFLLCLVLFWEAKPKPVPPLPNPNGYDDLVKAGKMIIGWVWTYDDGNLKQLSKIVMTNGPALALARRGMSNQCAVTLQYSKAYSKIHIQDLIGLRKLAQTFTAKGNVAAGDNHLDQATKSYLDVIRLGNDVRRGGVLADATVGIAMESLGVDHLQKLMDRLDARSCRQMAAALDTLDAQRPTWAEIVRQERDWSRRTYSGIRYALVRLMERNSAEKVTQNAKRNYEQQETRTRQLIVQLAARAYELDKGHRPAGVSDLVPDYLKAIPQNPVTGTNVVLLP